MKLFKTFQEAKIANPSYPITIVAIPGEGVRFYADPIGEAHHPHAANYCPSIADFLDAGFKFEIGDMFIGIDGEVKRILTAEKAHDCNIENYHDHKMHVLKSDQMEKQGIKYENGKFVKGYLTLPEIKSTHLHLNGKQYAIADIEKALELIDSIKNQ